MRLHTLPVVLLAVAPILVARAASAQPSAAEPSASAPDGERDPQPDPWHDLRNEIRFNNGLAVPAGDRSIEVERRILGPVTLSVGAGKARGGWQVASMARVQAAMNDRVAAGFGYGLSHGDYKEKVLYVFETVHRWKGVTWENAEAFVAARGQSGVTARGYLGLSAALRGGTCVAARESCGHLYSSTKMIPYLGFGIGKAL